MIKFEEWSSGAFGAATEKGLPVLLLLAPRRAAAALEEMFKGIEVEGRAVTMAVNEADRPDIWARYRPHGEVLLLNERGEVQDAVALGALSEKLPGWLKPDSIKKNTTGTEPQPPVWTGAVGKTEKRAVNPETPRLACEAVHSQKELSADGLALLLYAATEWKDAAAKRRAEQELDKAAAELRRGVESVGEYARKLKNLWDGFAAFGREAWRADASDCTALLVKERFDPARNCFRHSAAAGSQAYTDENCHAVLALQRAAVFEPGARYGQTADQVMGFLRDHYDPLLGLLHRKREDSVVYGLLGDSAWAILVFTEAFQLTGDKAHRAFADDLARFLFQELWDRDGGGFLDRVSRREDLGLLKKPRQAAPAEHAAALEGLWRLHHLMGNMNYRRWLEWALARAARPDAGSAGAARVQDMLARGRLDLHLIGRPGDPACDALLSAAHRAHAPRRIVSFVDPDDQDYILAHRLEAPSYPRLFGCVDLRPVADADAASGVPSVYSALGGAGG